MTVSENAILGDTSLRQSSSIAGMIAPATLLDLGPIVKVHQAAFPNFFMTLLGAAFLRRYYELIQCYEGGILLAFRTGAEVVAFVAGFVNPSAFYSRMRKRRITFAITMIPAFLRQPKIMGGAISDYLQTCEHSKGGRESDTAELASVCVRPEYEHRGIGGLLVTSFISEARERSAHQVVLTTDADGNDSVNLFYKRLGFRCSRTFEQRPGRMMNEYITFTEGAADTA